MISSLPLDTSPHLSLDTIDPCNFFLTTSLITTNMDMLTHCCAPFQSVAQGKITV